MDQLSRQKHAVDGQREEARATLLALMLVRASLAPRLGAPLCCSLLRKPLAPIQAAQPQSLRVLGGRDGVRGRPPQIHHPGDAASHVTALVHFLRVLSCSEHALALLPPPAHFLFATSALPASLNTRPGPPAPTRCTTTTSSSSSGPHAALSVSACGHCRRQPSWQTPPWWRQRSNRRRQLQPDPALPPPSYSPLTQHRAPQPRPQAPPAAAAAAAATAAAARAGKMSRARVSGRDPVVGTPP